MISKTVLLALTLSALAVPAMADCPGHRKPVDQSAAASPPAAPVVLPKASS